MDPEHIRELFSSFGPVAVRRMFGGFGIYADGVMFALSAEGLLYLKADEHTIPAFEREGARPFTYTARGKGNGRSKRVAMSYWRLPTASTTIPRSLPDGRGRPARRPTAPACE